MNTERLERPTFQADSKESGCSSTITNSYCIHETQIRFLNFSSLPDSASNEFKASVPSFACFGEFHDIIPLKGDQTTVSDSLTNNTLIPPPSYSVTTSSPSNKQPNIQRNSCGKSVIRSATSCDLRTGTKETCSRQGSAPKLTHVDLKMTGSSSKTLPQQLSTELKHKELLLLRKQLEEKLIHPTHRTVNEPDNMNEKVPDKNNIVDSLDNRLGMEVVKHRKSNNHNNLRHTFSCLSQSDTNHLCNDRTIDRLREKLQQQRALTASLTTGNHGIITTLEKTYQEKSRNKSWNQTEGSNTLRISNEKLIIKKEGRLGSNVLACSVCSHGAKDTDNSHHDRNNKSNHILDTIKYNIQVLSENARSILNELEQNT